MSDRGWKKAERRFAGDVGETRIPVTGERDGADFGAQAPFRYQLKIRKALPAWLFTWLSGIVATAKRAGPDVTGVLVLNRPRSPRRHALVILRWDDWVDLVGTPSVATHPEEEAVDPNGAGDALSHTPEQTCHKEASHG